MSNNSITVLISTFDPKRKKLLLKAINSIIQQSHKPNEVIIVDNNVELNNKLLVKKFNKKKNIKFKYMKYTKPGGAFAVRNHLMKKIKSNYVALLDDDDYWNKNYLKEFQRINYKKNYDLILANTYFVKKNKKREIFHIDINDFTVEKIGLYNPGIRSSATIIKRKSFLDINGYDLKLYYGSADKDFLSRFIKKKKKIKILKKVLVNYRIHESSHSRNTHLMLMSTIKYFSKYFFEISFFYKLRYLKKIFYYLILNLITLFNFSKI